MDRLVFGFFHSIANRAVFLDGVIGFLANYLTYFLVIAVLVFLYRSKFRPREKLFALITLVLSAVVSRGIVTEVIRFFYDRPRPFDALNITPLFLDSNPSFPSGHTTFLFAIALVLFYFNRKVGWWFTALSLLVVLSRVAAGVHWPSDVLGGLVVAFVSVWTVRRLLKKYEPETAKETLTSAS